MTTLDCLENSFSEIQRKRAFIEGNLLKLTHLIKKITNPGIQAHEANDLQLMKKQFLLLLGHTYWNHAIQLQETIEKQINQISIDYLIKTKKNILNIFQYAHDAYYQLPTILNTKDKRILLQRLAVSFEDLADSLAERLSGFGLNNEQKKENVKEIMEHYESALVIYRRLLIKAKIKTVSLNYLHCLYQAREINCISNEAFLLQLRDFINRYSLRTIQWGYKKNQEFQKYLKELEPQKTQATAGSPLKRKLGYFFVKSVGKVADHLEVTETVIKKPKL